MREGLGDRGTFRDPLSPEAQEPGTFGLDFAWEFADVLPGGDSIAVASLDVLSPDTPPPLALTKIATQGATRVIGWFRVQNPASEVQLVEVRCNAASAQGRDYRKSNFIKVQPT